MTTLSLNNHNEVFKKKPFGKSLFAYKAYSMIESLGGRIGLWVAAPVLFLFHIYSLYQLRRLNRNISKLRDRIYSDLALMEERRKVELELKWRSMAVEIEQSLPFHIKEIEPVASRSLIGRRVLFQLMQFAKTTKEVSETLTSSAYPKSEDMQREDFIKSLLVAYQGKSTDDWQDPAFDVYDDNFK